MKTRNAKATRNLEPFLAIRTQREYDETFHPKMCSVTQLAILLIVLTGVAGCSTPYQQRGFRGGYSDNQIGQDTVLISFKGNGYTSRERVQLYLLYRCAEVTQHDGYDYFVVTNGDTEAKTGYVSNYTATTYNSGIGSAQTFGAGTATPIRKYGTDAMIKMFKGHKPSDDPNAYDAEETIKYLGPELGLPQ